MGFLKFSILASFGDILAKKIVTNSWSIKGFRLHERALVWGFIGVLCAFIFPLYSSGVDALISIRMLPVFSEGFLNKLSVAFWKSFWINILFSFPLMTFHRITDTLIDQRLLFKKWDIVPVWNNIDWKNMWGFVAPSIFWFWLPAHTITFYLPSEFRILMASFLSICLGAILSFAKLKAVKVV